jgi:hypothetical protein
MRLNVLLLLDPPLSPQSLLLLDRPPPQPVLELRFGGLQHHAKGQVPVAADLLQLRVRQARDLRPGGDPREPQQHVGAEHIRGRLVRPTVGS